MTYGDSIILGIVEGVTEYLPISSTGHLILAGHFLGLEESEAIKAFDIVIQFGAILAVVGLYRDHIWKMLKGLLGKDAEGLRLFLCLVVSCLPISVIGLLLKEKIQASLFSVGTVAWALFVGGILILVFEYFQSKKTVFTEFLTYKGALLIGFIQAFALIPGTSRSMVTIMGAMLLGFGRKKAAEYSFLLALPVLGGACLIDFIKSYDVLVRDVGLGNIFLGMAVSCLVAALSIKFLIGILQRFGFALFGYYRILLALVLFFVLK